jgi:hypothetical protein
MGSSEAFFRKFRYLNALLYIVGLAVLPIAVQFLYLLNVAETFNWVKEFTSAYYVNLFVVVAFL